MRSIAVIAIALMMSLTAGGAAWAQPARMGAETARFSAADDSRSALTAVGQTSSAASAADAASTPSPTATSALTASTDAPTHAPTSTPVQRAQVDGLRLNVGSLSVELSAEQTQRVCVAELEVLGMDTGVTVEWYVSSRSGDSAKIELKSADNGRVEVYAWPLASGDSEFEITARCSNGVDSAEYTARLDVVVQAGESVPASIEGLDIIYNIAPDAELAIEPSNMADFPSGTTWQLTARSSALSIAQDGGRFTASSAAPGRHVALMTARTPGGVERMAYMMFVVGEDTTGDSPALNYSELNITLDMNRATGEAEFFIRPEASLGFVPARWSLVDGSDGIAELTLTSKYEGTLLTARPLAEGTTERMLRCEMPSLGAKVVLPISITVRRSDDTITGITLRRPEYSMRLSEALTLAPYALPVGISCPDGTSWSATQLDGPAGCLALNVDCSTGQTTIMASRTGVYQVEFAAQVSANRIYTSAVTLTVTE